MNNENLNNNSNTEKEIIDANLLNPFQNTNVQPTNNSNQIGNNITPTQNSTQELSNLVRNDQIYNTSNIVIQPVNNQINNNPFSNNQILSNETNSLPVDNSIKDVPISNQNNNSTININNIEIDDELLDAYIGPNAEKIKSQGISWPTFFFGIYYVMYRKMWFLVFAMFVISIIVSFFLPSFSIFISFGLGIFICALFNKIYVNHAKDAIKKIILKNPNASREFIRKKCQSKGGTSLVGVIVFLLVYSGLQIYLEEKERSIIASQWESYYRSGDKK